ncbi:MAG: ester cyclase [Microlunatus sp.]|nr:ester cyclase [Microlunatus sp.]
MITGWISSTGSCTRTSSRSTWGIPATDRRVAVEAWTFDKFRDGRMSSSRIIMDIFGLLQQLGAIPAQ